jgi:hypothetical protein
MGTRERGNYYCARASFPLCMYLFYIRTYHIDIDRVAPQPVIGLGLPFSTYVIKLIIRFDWREAAALKFT